MPNTARQVHDDIEGALSDGRRGTERDPSRSRAAAKVAGTRIWKALKHHPFVAGAAIAGLGVAAASAVGVGEILFGAGLAVAAYKVLRENEPPLQAIQDIEQRDV